MRSDLIHGQDALADEINSLVKKIFPDATNIIILASWSRRSDDDTQNVLEAGMVLKCHPVSAMATLTSAICQLADEAEEIYEQEKAQQNVHQG